MSIKIDKGIPLAVKLGRRGETRSKWALFDVGDSAFFPAGDSAILSNQSKSWGWSRTPRRCFAARTVTEAGVKGVRVWRTE